MALSHGIEQHWAGPASIRYTSYKQSSAETLQTTQRANQKVQRFGSSFFCFLGLLGIACRSRLILFGGWPWFAVAALPAAGHHRPWDSGLRYSDIDDTGHPLGHHWGTTRATTGPDAGAVRL